VVVRTTVVDDSIDGEEKFWLDLRESVQNTLSTKKREGVKNKNERKRNELIRSFCTTLIIDMPTPRISISKCQKRHNVVFGMWIRRRE